MNATFDSDGYPTDETLDTIRTWTNGDWSGLLAFVTSAWNTNYGAVRQKSSTIRFITGGWSGNEEVLSALKENTAFWTKFWLRDERGGLAVFDTESL